MNKFRNLLAFLLDTFDRLSFADKERYTERFSITMAVGAACVASSFFYWFLPPIVRVLVVPLFIGSAWWAGAKLIAPAVVNRQPVFQPPVSARARLTPFQLGFALSIACAAYAFFYWTFPVPERLLLVPLIVCAGGLLSRLR